MARWTAGGDDNPMIIETANEGHVSLHIPSGEPILADRDTAQDIRVKIGAAIVASTQEWHQ